MSYQKESRSVRSIDPHSVWHPGPVFSQVSTTTGPVRLVATSGQVGIDENNNLVADTDAQIAQAFTNLKRALAAAGAQVKDIYKLVWYVVDFDPNHRLYRPHLIKFLDGHRPATTLVPVPCLAEPGFKFEIEAYAAVRLDPARTVDVVVVGAGLSGLKAASDVQKAGYSCLVVEARDRVGGKTWSHDPLENGRNVDVGAAWINDTNQAKVYELAKALGIRLVQQYVEGDVVQEDIGGGLSTFKYGTSPSALAEQNGVENMIYIRDLFERTCQTIDLRNPTSSGKDFDAYSLEQWVKMQGGGETALASVRVWTRVMLGLEPSEISTLFFLDYCKSGGGLMQMRSDRKNGGQYYKLAQGTQALSVGLAESLAPGSIILNSPVRRIEQTPESILVSAGRGEIHCRRVIVSVPTPLYKEITFEPPLPKAKEQLSQANKLGCTFKVMLLYAQPWWRGSGLCGMVQSFQGPVCVTRDSSIEETGNYTLTCFVGGQPGRSLLTLTQKERHDAVLSHVRRLFCPFTKTVPEPLAVTDHLWIQDQWSQGCPCPAAPPGAMTNYGHALRTPHLRAHFVGTETAFEWKGYLDGAVRSGERGAKEVIQALSKSRL
ncbi:hypothetical protein CLAIMM_00507 [Cladophialophora immunda]|nr:hypothetical protein CLAIMM_00507 [Cladophialophora immunda]